MAADFVPGPFHVRRDYHRRNAPRNDPDFHRAHLRLGDQARAGTSAPVSTQQAKLKFYNVIFQDFIYSAMGFVFFLTDGIMALDNYVVYRNRPGNLNAGRSLGVRRAAIGSFIDSDIYRFVFHSGYADNQLVLLPAQRCRFPYENLHEGLATASADPRIPSLNREETSLPSIYLKMNEI